MLSKDRWLAALKAIDVEPTVDHPDALTIDELMAVWDCGRSAAEERTRRLVAAKKAIRVRVRRPRTGRMSTLNGYVLKG